MVKDKDHGWSMVKVRKLKHRRRSWLGLNRHTLTFCLASWSTILAKCVVYFRPVGGIAQVFIINYTHRCRKSTRNGLWYQIYPSTNDLLDNNMCTACALVNRQSDLRQRRKDRKGMKGQQGRQPGTAKEIVFALSMFAQFSAGQILALVLGSRSCLLDLTPFPQRPTGKKRTGWGRREEDKLERNS